MSMAMTGCTNSGTEAVLRTAEYLRLLPADSAEGDAGNRAGRRRGIAGDSAMRCGENSAGKGAAPGRQNNGTRDDGVRWPVMGPTSEGEPEAG